ncbi:Flap-structured DNA-binding and RNA-binding protein, partial [Basidiobolus ranarum]
MTTQQSFSESLPFQQERSTDSQQATGNRLRPISEIIASKSFKTSEDTWNEDLAQYERTLEDMSSANLDQNFKEELNAIQQWYKTLSESEKTAAMYSLLQFSTPVQIQFFIVALLQLANKEPMKPVLSSDSVGK